MPLRVQWRSWWGICVLCALASEAHAQVTSETRDFPIERFRWAFTSAGILGAESASLAARGSWDAALWIGASDDPLVLLRKGESGATELTALVARRTAAAVLFSYAWASWELGLEIPLVLAQSRDAMAPGVQGMLDSISGAGLGDVRLAPKLALLRQARHGADVAVTASLTLPTAGASEYRGEPSLSLAPELLVGRTFDAWRAIANVGYRARENTSLLDLVVRDELFGVAGLARRFERVEAAAALSWATAAADPFGADNSDHVEALAGVTIELGPLELAAIGGAGLGRGFGTPDWRFIVAARFQEAPRATLADEDGDAIADSADACPRDAENRDGWRDDDGCPEPDARRGTLATAPPEAATPPPDEAGAKRAGDADGDGVDEGDACPEAPEDKDGWRDDDGCPDADNDGDGLADADDACPQLAGVSQRQGCPDPDRDGDGLVDRLDNCPDRRGSLANHGCDAAQLVRLTEDRLELSSVVAFETDSDRLLPRALLLLNNAAEVLLAHPDLARITVEGHTDDQGSEDSNLDLSRRRAAAVVRYLVARGVSNDRLAAQGFGEARPVADNVSAAGRAKNRRVELRVSTLRRQVIDFPDEVIQSQLPKPSRPPP